VIRVTADSNIYISALHFGGPPDDLLALARAGAIPLMVSDEILDEVTRVLRDKFGWTPDAATVAREVIEGFTEKVKPTQRLDIIKEDPTDDRILECAVAGKSEYLVTRDKHLLMLGRYGGTEIIKVADLLQKLRQQGQGR
jgi:uncharacterized protein